MVVYCVAFVMAASLALGSDLYPQGGVSVALASINRANVQAALRVADDVLLPAGFTRGQLSPTAVGEVADYTRDNSVGSPSGCRVFINNGGLMFSFIESGIPRPSPAANQLSQQLADALRARFGAAAVEVQLK